MFNIENIINNILATLYSDRQLLDLKLPPSNIIIYPLNVSVYHIFLIYLLSAMQDLSFPTRDQTCAP